MAVRIMPDTSLSRQRGVKENRSGRYAPDPERAGSANRTVREAEIEEREEAMDESLEMTFPASDPPAWMG